MLKAQSDHLKQQKVKIPEPIQMMILLASLPKEWEGLLPLLLGQKEAVDIDWSTSVQLLLVHWESKSACSSGSQASSAQPLSSIKKKKGNPSYTNQKGKGKVPAKGDSSSGQQKKGKKHGSCGGKKKQQHVHLASTASLPPPTSSTIAAISTNGSLLQRLSLETSPAQSTGQGSLYPSFNSAMSLANEDTAPCTIQCVQNIEQDILQHNWSGRMSVSKTWSDRTGDGASISSFIEEVESDERIVHPPADSDDKSESEQEDEEEERVGINEIIQEHQLMMTHSVQASKQMRVDTLKL